MKKNLRLLALASVALAAGVHGGEQAAHEPAALDIQPSGKVVAPSTDVSASDVLAKMKAALVPARPVYLRAVLSQRVSNGQTRQWRVAMIRKAFPDGMRTVVVFQLPGGDSGVALLEGTRTSQGEQVEAMYLPLEQRVRLLTPVYPEDPFLGTDFTRADLLLATTGEHTVKLLGVSELGERMTYRIEERPTYDSKFSRIVTWVAADDFLPVKREYYDRANRLWKVAEYHDVEINGAPTIISIDMRDVQTRGDTRFEVRSVRYDEQMSDELFRTERLGRTVEEIAW